MTASFSTPSDFEWPSPIDRALNAGYDPQPGDADQPVMNDAELADYFARMAEARKGRAA